MGALIGDKTTEKEIHNGDAYTDWFRDGEGNFTVRYTTVGGAWAQVVEVIETNGVRAYDVSWSEEPGEVRTIYDHDEAMAFAKWLIK